VPIPKVSSTNNTSDFHPISLLPIFSKVLECHLRAHINERLSEHSPLANCQWEFQEGKSTVSALLHVTHDWFQQLERNRSYVLLFSESVWHCSPWATALKTQRAQPRSQHICVDPQSPGW